MLRQAISGSFDVQMQGRFTWIGVLIASEPEEVVAALIGKASQSVQRTRGELRTGVLIRTITTGPHQGGNGGTPEDKALTVVETTAKTGVGQLAEALKKVIQGRCLEGTWTCDIGLEADQCHRLTVELGDVAQVLPNENGVVQVVAFFEKMIKASAFAILKKSDGHPGQQVRLTGI